VAPDQGRRVEVRLGLRGQALLVVGVEAAPALVIACWGLSAVSQ
jgi:hypothetical protein